MTDEGAAEQIVLGSRRWMDGSVERSSRDWRLLYLWVGHDEEPDLRLGRGM